MASSRSASTTTPTSPTEKVPVDYNAVEWWTGLSEKDVATALALEGGGAEDGWKLVKEEGQGAKVWRKALPDQAYELIKGTIQLPGMPPDIAVRLFSDGTLRPQWDENYDGRVLQEHESDNGGHPQQLLQLALKMPPPIDRRDFIHTTYRHDDDSGMCVLLSRSVDHPALPPQKGVVRAQTHLAAVIVRPLQLDPASADKKDQINPELYLDSSQLTVILHMDLKGKVPAWAVNRTVVRQPIKWRALLLQFYHKTPAGRASLSSVSSVSSRSSSSSSTS